MKAIVVNMATEEPIGEIKQPSKGDLFTACQYAYGHCLGKNTDKDGNTTSWVFSHCIKDGEACKVEVVKIYIE